MPNAHQRSCLFATLPGFTGATTYADWPVWSDSTRKEVNFQPMPKKAATRLWHRARDFDRQTRGSRGKRTHGGELGHAVLQVLHTLIFDFLNFRTGRLDPSYAAIARKANVCERTVATALARLKELRILNWMRRCAETWRDGRYVLEQQTNAYAVLPCSQWHGYREPPEAPPPPPGTWGDHPRMPSVLDLAVLERQASSSERSVIAVLQTAPPNSLEAALARLGLAMQARNPQ
jgi:hypothetical protein